MHLFALLSTQSNLREDCHLLEGGATASITWAICWLLWKITVPPVTHREPTPTELWVCGLLLKLCHSPALCLPLSGLNKL